VLQAIEQARRWDTPTTPAPERARLARVLASGYASQGRFAEAYREIERHDPLTDEARSFAADVQTLRLQARYAAASARLKTPNCATAKTARLALAAETAKQRALWATVATLVLLIAGGLAWARQALQAAPRPGRSGAARRLDGTAQSACRARLRAGPGAPGAAPGRAPGAGHHRSGSLQGGQRQPGPLGW
jgi:hypothetical protein